MCGLEALKPGWFRVNLNYFFDFATTEFICDAIEFIAAEGWRLLPDYELKKGTGTCVTGCGCMWLMRMHVRERASDCIVYAYIRLYTYVCTAQVCSRIARRPSSRRPGTSPTFSTTSRARCALTRCTARATTSAKR
jgi:hypothetical protein